MIKKEQFAKESTVGLKEKIDTLISVVGELVTTLKGTDRVSLAQKVPVVRQKRKYTRRLPVKTGLTPLGHSRYKIHGTSFPSSLYDELDLLPVGGTYDVTSIARMCGTPFIYAKDRIRSVMFKRNREYGVDKAYTTTRISGAIIVTRVR
jgi:hypothetical protein